MATNLGPRAGIIYHSLRTAIENGSLDVGAVLPSRLELARQYGVAAMTVAQAIEALQRDGLVEARIGSGTYVRSRSPQPPAATPLQSIIEASPLAIITFDHMRVVTSWNPAAERLFGWSRDEVLGGPHRGVPPEAQEQFNDRLHRVLGGETITGVAERVRKDGSRLWVSTSNAPVCDAAGQVVGLVSFAEDITDHRAQAAALRRREAVFRAMFDRAAVPMGIARARVDGTFEQSNGALQAFLGYSADELASLTVTDISHPHDLQVGLELLAELVSGERETYEFEKRYIRKDGAIVWGHVSASLIEDESGQPDSVAVMIEDITAFKRAEAEARLGALRYLDLAEGAHDVILNLDRSGHVVFLNREAEHTTGYSRDEASLLTFAQMVMPDQRVRVGRIIADRLAGLDGGEERIDLIAKTGERVPLEVSVTLIEGADVAPTIQIIGQRPAA